MNPASNERFHQSHSTGEAQQRRVHTITDRFSMANTYLIVDEHFVVVDPGSERNVRLLQIYIQNILKRDISEIDLIVLTHLHPDHTAGVDLLHRLCHAPVAASQIIQQLYQEAQAGSSQEPSLSSATIRQFAEKMLPGILHHLDLFPPAYERAMHIIHLWLRDVEGLPGHPDWRVIASPGHTPESLCLYNPFTLELLCGDTFITLQGGAPLVRGGTNRKMLEETIKVLRSLHIHYLYPGHGRAIIGLRPLNNIEVEW